MTPKPATISDEHLATRRKLVERRDALNARQESLERRQAELNEEAQQIVNESVALEGAWDFWRTETIDPAYGTENGKDSIEDDGKIVWAEPNRAARRRASRARPKPRPKRK